MNLELEKGKRAKLETAREEISLFLSGAQKGREEKKHYDGTVIKIESVNHLRDEDLERWARYKELVGETKKILDNDEDENFLDNLKNLYQNFNNLKREFIEEYNKIPVELESNKSDKEKKGDNKISVKYFYEWMRNRITAINAFFELFFIEKDKIDNADELVMQYRELVDGEYEKLF